MAMPSAQAVKELRDMTGLGMMECKKILAESNNDLGKAKELARKRGQDKKDKLSGRATTEGIIEFYMHHNNRVGVMIEMNCNTDFVARNESFVQLAKDLAMHIAALRPEVVERDQLDPQLVQMRRDGIAEEVGSNKPPEILNKIVDGKMGAWYAERVLLDQPFAKDQTKTVREMVDDLISNTGENINISRFVRFEVGEGAKTDAPEGDE